MAKQTKRRAPGKAKPRAARTLTASSVTAFIQIRPAEGKQIISEVRRFTRVPVVGDCFALDVSSPWYRVTAVVHCPWDRADWDAEICAIPVNHMAVLKSALTVDARSPVNLDDTPGNREWLKKGNDDERAGE